MPLFLYRRNITVLFPGLGVDLGQMLNLVAGIQVEVDASDAVLPVALGGVAEEHRALQVALSP